MENEPNSFEIPRTSCQRFAARPNYLHPMKLRPRGLPHLQHINVRWRTYRLRKDRYYPFVSSAIAGRAAERRLFAKSDSVLAVQGAPYAQERCESARRHVSNRRRRQSHQERCPPQSSRQRKQAGRAQAGIAPPETSPGSLRAGRKDALRLLHQRWIDVGPRRSARRQKRGSRPHRQGRLRGPTPSGGLSNQPHACRHSGRRLRLPLQCRRPPPSTPQCPVLAEQLHRFGHKLAMQTTQLAACNRLHEVEARLARWIS